MVELEALDNQKFDMKYYDLQKCNREISRTEPNEKYLRQCLHRKPEIILAATTVANLDTLFPSLI